MATAFDTADPTAWVCEAAKAAFEDPFSPDDEPDIGTRRKAVGRGPQQPQSPPQKKMRSSEEAHTRNNGFEETTETPWKGKWGKGFGKVGAKGKEVGAKGK